MMQPSANDVDQERNYSMSELTALTRATMMTFV